jgi:hypothetical protein
LPALCGVHGLSGADASFAIVARVKEAGTESQGVRIAGRRLRPLIICSRNVKVDEANSALEYPLRVESTGRKQFQVVCAVLKGIIESRITVASELIDMFCNGIYSTLMCKVVSVSRPASSGLIGR